MEAIESYWWLGILILFALGTVLYRHGGFRSWPSDNDASSDIPDGQKLRIAPQTQLTVESASIVSSLGTGAESRQPLRRPRDAG